MGCFLRLLYWERLSDGLWARLFLSVCAKSLSPPPPCSVPQKAASPQLPCLLALGSANKGPWPEKGIKKKQAFSPRQAVIFAVGTSLYLRQRSCLVAPLSWWRPPLPLVPVGLIYVDCSSRFSRPLASPTAVTEQHLQDTRQREECGSAIHSPRNSLQWPLTLPWRSLPLPFYQRSST